MKKTILTLVMALTLGTLMAAPVNDTTTVDTTTQVDEVEAFSDTTTVDTATTAATNIDADPFDKDWEDWDADDANSFLAHIGIDGGDLAGMFFALCVLFILFILAPVLIIGLILYFIYKNRKDRMRLAEMAMKNGKPIPLDVMGSPMTSNDALWNKGIKQMFLGAGLAILLWMFIGKIGFGIGALVLLIGCGNLVIAHQEREKQKQREMYDNFFGNEKSDSEIERTKPGV